MRRTREARVGALAGGVQSLRDPARQLRALHREHRHDESGAVELADGLSKDQIGVRADETIAPLTQ